MIKEQTQIIYKSVVDLIPYVNNSRTHTENQVLQIAASIKEFGFTNPVLIDSDNGIIAGHGRVLAAQKLDIKQIPCIELPYLSEIQKKAYVIADNKLALNAGWDFELLRIEIESLKNVDFDLPTLGFSDQEFSNILDIDFLPGTESDQGKLDEMEEKLCPHCGGVL